MNLLEARLATSSQRRLAGTRFPATSTILEERNIFSPAEDIERLGEPRLCTIHTQAGSTSVASDLDLSPLLNDTFACPNTEWAVISLRRPDSESPLSISEAQFEGLRALIPSFEDLAAFVSAFADDQRSISFPPPIHRVLERGEGSNLGKGFELIYGFGYYDRQPRNRVVAADAAAGAADDGDRGHAQDEDEDEVDDYVDWPLRRTVVYHQHLKKAPDGSARSLWILCSAKVHLEEAIMSFLRETPSTPDREPFEAHAYLASYCLQLWRLMLLDCAHWLQLSFDEAFSVEVGKLTAEQVQQAWRKCLALTDTTDKIEDGVVAAEAVESTLQSISRFSLFFNNPDVHEEHRRENIIAQTGLFQEQLRTCHALRRELVAYAKKAERTALTYSRLSELRHEDYNRVMKGIADNTAALANLNRGWERDKDYREKQGSINSGLGTFIAVLGVVLLPVGVVGTFLSVSKVLPQNLWWIYLVVLVSCWTATLLLWWVGSKLRWWRLCFWLPEKQSGAQRVFDVEDSSEEKFNDGY